MVEFFPEQAIFASFGSIAIRWYGIAYVFAFWAAWYALPVLGARKALALSRDQWTFICALAALGVLAGGRIGYAIFYEPMYFFANPVELIRIWHGGMSSHGGFLGAATGVWIAVRIITLEGLGEVRRNTLLAVADVLSIPASFGLAIGRLANIANGEFGSYPYYEAGADFAIAAVCFAMLYRHVVPLSPRGEREGVYPERSVGCRAVSRRSLPSSRPTLKLWPTRRAQLPCPAKPWRSWGEKETRALPGNIFATFLILYGTVRFLLEFIRVQEWPMVWGLSLGQLYTIPLFLFGMLLLAYVRNSRVQSKISGPQYPPKTSR